VSCSRPHCTFCFTSLDKNFRIRPVNDIVGDIDFARQHYQDQVQKIFLLAANPLVMITADLVKIANYCRTSFPKLKQISMYAHPLDILSKTSDDLKDITNAGIDLLYIGIESGNDSVLKMTKKQSTADIHVRSCLKALDAGFRLSCMAITGLGGKELSKHHAIDTGKVLSEISPHFIGMLTFMVYPGTEIEQSIQNGSMKLLSDMEALKELELLVKHLDISNRDCVFRANHPSNYVTIGGTLPRDKQRLLSTLQQARNHPENYKANLLRGL